MRKEKLLAFMLFCQLVHEDEVVAAFYNELWTPARLLEWFTRPLPIKVSLFEIVCLILLFTSLKGRKAASVKPLVRTLSVSTASMMFCVLYGVITGGELKPIYTQTHVWLWALVFGLTVMKVLTKSEDFYRMNTAIVWAAIWRSAIAIVFYMKVSGRPWDKFPPHMTTHEDTVLFVVGLLILVSRAIEFRTKRALRLLMLATPVILLAIQFNNRRLAWASLAFGLMIIYFLLPAKSRVTKRLNRSILIATPLIAIYVMVGWGRTEKIFKPLASFSSMTDSKTDKSTMARDNENMSLMTMIRDRPILGTGLGHEWVELDNRFTVPLSVFPMYHYCPHNSVLALIAFCGGLGFAGLWMVIPVSAYLNARAYRVATDPAIRSGAIIGVVEVVVYLNQAWGDMGAMNITHMLPACILGMSIGSASRLALNSGAWPSGVRGNLPEARRTANEPMR